MNVSNIHLHNMTKEMACHGNEGEQTTVCIYCKPKKKKNIVTKFCTCEILSTAASLRHVKAWSEKLGTDVQTDISSLSVYLRKVKNKGDKRILLLMSHVSQVFFSQIFLSFSRSRHSVSKNLPSLVTYTVEFAISLLLATRREGQVNSDTLPCIRIFQEMRTWVLKIQGNLWS